MTKSPLEELLYQHIIQANLPLPVREYRFDPREKWKSDFAWPKLRLLVEVEGGVHSGGRHVRGAGYTKDCIKYNAATLQGWQVLRFTGGMVEDGTALNTLLAWFNFTTRAELQ